MGTTYFVVNTAKCQYFDPSRMGWDENTKRSGILWGLSGHALAQLLLPELMLDFHLDSWVGDPLVLVGDDASPSSIELLRPFQKNQCQHAYHIVVEGFDDITLNVIALLCKDAKILEHFLVNAQRHNYGFVDLAHISMYLSARHVDIALADRFGTDWRARYAATLAAEPWHYPLPITPDTRKLDRPRVLRAADPTRQGRQSQQ